MGNLVSQILDYGKELPIPQVSSEQPVIYVNWSFYLLLVYLLLLPIYICWESRKDANTTQAPLSAPHMASPTHNQQSSEGGEQVREDHWREENRKKKEMLETHNYQEASESFLQFVRRICSHFYQSGILLTDQELIKFTLRNIHPRYLNLWHREYASMEVLVHEAQTNEWLGLYYPYEEPNVDKKEEIVEGANKVEKSQEMETKEEPKINVEVVKEGTLIEETVEEEPIQESGEADGPSETENGEVVIQGKTNPVSFQIYHTSPINYSALVAWTISKVLRHWSHNLLRKRKIGGSVSVRSGCVWQRSTARAAVNSEEEKLFR
jgi:hypothetical protein